MLRTKNTGLSPFYQIYDSQEYLGDLGTCKILRNICLINSLNVLKGNLDLFIFQAKRVLRYLLIQPQMLLLPQSNLIIFTVKLKEDWREFEYVTVAETKVACSGVDKSRGLGTSEF